MGMDVLAIIDALARPLLYPLCSDMLAYVVSIGTVDIVEEEDLPNTTNAPSKTDSSIRGEESSI